MVYGLDIKPFFNFWEEKVALKELNYEELELLNIKSKSSLLIEVTDIKK